MMDGSWRDHLRQVLKLNAEEIPLWERLAEAAPTRQMGNLIRMMIRQEREESELLRMLLEEYKDDSGYAPGPDYSPGYGPGYDPGYEPGYGPGFNPMPYSEKDKEKG